MTHLSYSTLLNQYEKLAQEVDRSKIGAMLRQEKIKLIALDDDPTGIQTVHGCLLLTDWQEDVLRKAFQHEMPFFYVLTNTRALTVKEAAQRTQSAMEAILKVNKDFGYKLIFVSRSDSTLRGHFPLETDIMRKALTEKDIPILPVTFFIPAFIEAGRFTVNGIHYLKNKDELIPVSETEFAHDNVFAYHHAVLQDYLVEKTGCPSLPYESFSLDNFQTLSEKERFEKGQTIIERELAKEKTSAEPLYISVDALRYNDLQRFSISFLQWMSRFDGAAVLRTSSSLPKALSGICDKEILSKTDLMNNSVVSHSERSKISGGLFIVGSHVKKSSEQLQKLLDIEQTQGIELDIHQILHDSDHLLQQVEKQIKEIADQGQTPVIFTARQEIRLEDAGERQLLGQKVSDFLVEIVRNLPFRPSYLIAKGGITSHDILTKGLKIQSAEVMGQILSGVPCIKTTKESTFPDMPYVIFPGNVGEVDSLAEVFKKLQ